MLYTLGEREQNSDRAPHGLGSLVRAQMESLIWHKQLRDNVAGKLREVFELYTRESLDSPAHPPFTGLSHINADGLPFQWVLRSGAAENGFGFLCEVGAPGDHLKRRCELTRMRLKEGCVLRDFSPSWLDQLADIVLPNSLEAWPEHWRSAMWIGVAAGPDGIVVKPYFNLSRGSVRDRWVRAGWVLKKFGRERALVALCRLSSVVSAGCLPVGLAADITPSGQPSRIKIYFRSNAVTAEWLEPWYALEGRDDYRTELSRCFEYFPLFGRKSFPPAAFTMSLESHADDNMSLKCDFAVTKWVSNDREIFRGVCALVHEFGNDRNELQGELESIGAWPLSSASCSLMRFVGLGHEPDGSTHINLYVAPPLEKAKNSRHVPRSPLREAISRGCGFLARNHHDGYWSDFALPVGPSDTWVTAYVLARLGKVDRHLWGEQLRECVDQSLAWLDRSQRPCGGWGYNGCVPPDADSTAWAILAFRRHGQRLKCTPDAIFRRWEDGTGACATYAMADRLGKGWSAAAPDVTACALSARSADWSTAIEARFSRWMLPDGTLPAYWWTSRFYTISMLLDWNARLIDVPLLSRTMDTLEKTAPTGVFDAALQLHCLSCFRNGRAQEIVELLCREQKFDGSWPASAQLRLTDTSISEPWTVLCCLPIYGDHRAVFTTATVMFALSHYDSGETRTDS